MNLLKKLAPYLLIAHLAACVTNPPMEKATPSAKMDSAPFRHYSLRIIASDAANVRCDYGPQRVADYDRHIEPDERAGQNLSRGFYTVYPEMKCTWADGAGNRHKAILDMPELLKHMHAEWEHIEGETVVDKDPLQSPPEFHIEINRDLISVTSKFTVLILGDPISATRRKLKPVPIARQLIQLRP